MRPAPRHTPYVALQRRAGDALVSVLPRLRRPQYDTPRLAPTPATSAVLPTTPGSKLPATECSASPTTLARNPLPTPPQEDSAPSSADAAPGNASPFLTAAPSPTTPRSPSPSPDPLRRSPRRNLGACRSRPRRRRDPTRAYHAPWTPYSASIAADEPPYTPPTRVPPPSPSFSSPPDPTPTSATGTGIRQ